MKIVEKYGRFCSPKIATRSWPLPGIGRYKKKPPLRSASISFNTSHSRPRWHVIRVLARIFGIAVDPRERQHPAGPNSGTGRASGSGVARNTTHRKGLPPVKAGPSLGRLPPEGRSRRLQFSHLHQALIDWALSSASRDGRTVPLFPSETSAPPISR